LVEVPLGGYSFTWCHKSAKKMSKLDRFLISVNLMCSCPSISSTSLDRFISDHRPIIMWEAHYDYGPVPFKFFYYWFELDGFDKLVEQTWLEANVNDQNSYSKFMNKLKYLKEKIWIWATLHKESLNSRKSILKAELANLDGVIDKGEGSDADGHRRREVVRLIQEVEKVDAMEVAQKAKIKWSIEGDENSKYYHGVLNKKRGRLTIRRVLVDGIWMESPHLVKHEFFKHFKHRFEKPNKSRMLIEKDFIKRISLEQNDDLKREVSNEEIKMAVWDCGIDKALGPDGFTFEIPKGGTSSFITLIPKVPNANMVKDFIPISLIGSFYKVIAKVLTNRLVTNKKKQSMIFKVDFEKAYDSVIWDFIDDILRRFGFEEKWCKWVQSCLYSSRGSVLVNGSPTKEFQFHKGLKLDDLLSPFLFILVMESLHVSFQRVVDASLFNGIKLDSSLHISHLFYADDAIFMGQLRQCNIITIIRVLDVFYRASGLRINMNKSNLMGISVDSNKVKHAAAKIGCLVLKTPFNYLGSRLGDLLSRIQSWHDATEGMHTRLSKWKLKTLSIGGRLTLLKSVLGAIPIYHMSIFKVPMKVLHNMKSVRARFFNGADANSMKPSWVRWKSVLAAKDVGGLGLVKALRGEDGKIGKKVQPRYPSTWINFINEIENLKLHGIDLVSFITPKLGDEANTSFRDVAWCGDIAFKNLVLKLYALESMKNIEVASKLSHESLEFSFRRNPRGGVEQAQFKRLKEMVEGVTLRYFEDEMDQRGSLLTMLFFRRVFRRRDGSKRETANNRVKEAALRLGCLTLKTPFLYLGSKVGGSMYRLHEWDEVVERVKMQLFKWKMKSLSIGGRLTLLKSVLGSMTIFNMSIFKVPLGGFTYS
nr:putative RNA-directed DNA polymerase, eukaryota, reverse transcriptase zinc-binding domain protein [Tanacetum cinerariifolium]